MADAEPKPEEAEPAAAEPAAAAMEIAEEEDTSNRPTPEPSFPTSKKRKSDGVSRELAIDPLALPTKSKRERKSVEKFEADDFVAAAAAKAEQKEMHGRGTRLEDIESTRESIKAAKMKGPQLAAAHNLVFGGRAKDRLKKQQLLDFAGYLPIKEKGVDKDKQKEIDEEIETKFATKAQKLTIAALKNMCDFFDVDRSAGAGEKQDKDFLVDKLLDFLSEPNKKLTKTWIKNNKKKASAAARKEKEAAKKSKKEKAEESESDDDVEEEDDTFEEVDGKKMPTDKALKRWVKAYVRCFNLDKATTKHAMETASDKFGVDLSDKKPRIKELLTEAMD